MKKTITTLLALASSIYASEISLKDALYTSTTDITNISGVSGSYAYTISLDLEAMTSILGKTSGEGVVRPMLVVADNNFDMGLAMALNNTGFVGTYNFNSSDMTNLTMAGGNGENRQPMTGNGSTPATNAFANGDVNSLNSTFNKLSGIALTFSHTDKNSSSLYVTLAYNDGTSKELYGTNTGFMWSGGVSSLNNLYINENYIDTVYLFNQAIDQTTAFKLNTAAIPEPTTATLSLLALAGLAARRRRR